jgi:hypothetical protein
MTLIVKVWPGAAVVCVGETDMLACEVLKRAVLVKAPRRSITIVPRRDLFKRFA